MARDQITDEGPERNFWSCFAGKVTDRNSKTKKEIKTRPSTPKRDQKIIMNQSEPILAELHARGARERSPIAK